MTARTRCGTLRPSTNFEGSRMTLARRPLLAALLATVALAALATTVGSGQPRTETRDASGFAAVAMRGDIDVVVRQAAKESVQVTTDDNLLPLLETVVDNGTLRIQWKRGESVRTRGKTLVTVDVVKLSAVSLSGSGDLRVEPLKTPSLALSISGSSDAALDRLDAGELKISISGSGDVKASGKATKLDISIAGSGDVQARELVADQASVSIAGSGDAKVTAAKTLAVSIAGSGDVEFGGGAVLANSRVAGSGSIRQRP
jgi:Putative auto-transporter adhesin, head GIN domain